MSKIHFEQSIMGASLYYNDQFICNVSGMEDAERLNKLLAEKQQRLDNIEIALTELIDAVLNMDINKQKEVIRFAKKLLEKGSTCGSNLKRAARG